MSEAFVAAGPGVALADAHAFVDDLLAADLTGGSDAELLDTMREVERLSRRLAAVGHALIAEASARSLPDSRGASSMAALVRQVLRLHPCEAAARVRAAEAAGPRRTLTGEPLEPVFADVAAAQLDGVISPEHARVIVRAVDALPAAVQAEHGVEVERELVADAATFDPQSLHKLALHIHTYLDPDGSLDDPNERDRTRDLTVRHRPDGSASVRGELTADAPNASSACSTPSPPLTRRPTGSKTAAAPGNAATTRCSTRSPAYVWPGPCPPQVGSPPR